MIRPAPLKQGDTVAIVSPAGALRSPDIVERAARTLAGWGLRPLVAPHCLARHGYYAGTPEERADDILSMLADDNVKAVLCSYGGYGCVHLLERFAPAVARHPKWIMGMSDCSALLAAAFSVGVQSVHSSQCSHLADFPSDETSANIRKILFGASVQYVTESHGLNIVGTARGRLVGGNLSVLCSLLRTPYDPFVPGIILFIEDINEPPYRVERMLYNLKMAGILRQAAGIIVGQFTGCKEHGGFGGSLYEIIHSVVADCGVPVCFDFPVGHCDYNLPLIVGAEAELFVTPAAVRISL